MNDPSRNTAIRPKGTVGIKEIASSLGISIGTVDRALHGRPGINPVTCARVLKMAQTLGYRPNIAARNLKLKRKLNFAVILPREIAFFYDTLRKGIIEAAAPFASTVDLTFLTVRRLGEGEAGAFRQALESQTNGIIVAPGHPADLKSLIRKAARQNVPVVCVSTDAPKTERLTVVSADPYTAGALVGETMLRCVRDVGSVLVVTGDLSTVDHAEKLRGFKDFLGTGAHLSVGPVVQAHDDPEEADRSVRQCLSTVRHLQAVYVSTANSLPVLRVLEEAHCLGKLAVVVTDLFPELVPYIRQGRILGTVYQRPHTQGRKAFQSLYEFLVDGKCPKARLRLAPHLISRSNLELYLEILSSSPESREGNDAAQINSY